jgi:hypothetical protein
MPENDPFEPLDNFPEGLHVNALPASEVRRRGDRMRRRNTAVATVGGVVAAAVFIGVPVALMSGNDSDTVDPAPPAPTRTDDPAPSESWITEIPEDFPVTEGMTDEGEPTEGDLDAIALCDTSYPTSRGTADSVTYFYSGDGESSATRVFQLWPDDAAAYRSIDQLEEAVQDCPQQPTAGGDSVFETRLVDFDTGGDASLTFVRQVVGDDGLVSQLDTVEVTQVGNAVLVDWSYGAAGGDQAIDIATRILAERSATTRAAMCVFSADPCAGGEPVATPEGAGDGDPTAQGTDTTAIPDDFPLVQGMDDGGDSDVEGPGPGVEGARVVDLCGTEVFAPSGMVARQAARETGIEYLETREVMTFISADEPAEALTQVREAVSGCARIAGEFYDWTPRLLEGPPGFDSVTWGFFADETLDGGVFQITRVGSAVLVLYAAGEMSEPSLQPTADSLTETTLALAPEMCLWTEGGC